MVPPGALARVWCGDLDGFSESDRRIERAAMGLRARNEVTSFPCLGAVTHEILVSTGTINHPKILFADTIQNLRLPMAAQRSSPKNGELYRRATVLS